MSFRGFVKSVIEWVNVTFVSRGFGRKLRLAGIKGGTQIQRERPARKQLSRYCPGHVCACVRVCIEVCDARASHHTRSKDTRTTRAAGLCVFRVCVCARARAGHTRILSGQLRRSVWTSSQQSVTRVAVE